MKISEISQLYINSGISNQVIVANIREGNKEISIIGKNDGIAIDSKTYFDIASITKPIISVMGLLELKKYGISIDEKVGDYLEFLSEFDCKILNLINHTNGISLKKDHFYDKSKNYTIDEIKNLIENKNHLEKISPKYSNFGNLFFGMILEKITGKTLDILFKNFCQRFGINNITYEPLKNGVDLKNIIKSSEDVDKGIVHDHLTKFYGGITGCAGLFANMDGLLDFSKKWMNNYFGFDEKFWNEENYRYCTGEIGLVWKRSLIRENILSFGGNTGTLVFMNPKKKSCIISFCNLLILGKESYSNRRQEYLEFERDLVSIII